LFCQRPGTSREHILARWIGASLSDNPPPGATVQLTHETFGPDGNLIARKSAKRTAFYTRAFCTTCNNTWMSRLDELVKPMLLEMMFARLPVTLTLDEQRVLTLWATKVALGFQTQEPPASRWARPKQYHDFYETQSPLAGSQVWIAARQQWHPAMYRGHSTALGDGTIEVDGFGVILSVGFAVFWILIPYQFRPLLRLFSDSAMLAKPIWPGRDRPVQWPPLLGIEGVDLTGLPTLLLRKSRMA
jgi:hypothetical protein